MDATLTINDVTGNPSSEKLARYLGSSRAVTLPNIIGGVSNTVVIGTAFLNSISYGSTLIQLQNITLVHEALHTGTGDNDPKLASDLHLGNFSNAPSDIQAASTKISQWLANCSLPK